MLFCTINVSYAKSIRDFVGLVDSLTHNNHGYNVDIPPVKLDIIINVCVVITDQITGS